MKSKLKVILIKKGNKKIKQPMFPVLRSGLVTNMLSFNFGPFVISKRNHCIFTNCILVILDTRMMETCPVVFLNIYKWRPMDHYLRRWDLRNKIMVNIHHFKQPQLVQWSITWHWCVVRLVSVLATLFGKRFSAVW